jgi:nucleoside-diphosphate-sugar epimerase
MLSIKYIDIPSRMTLVKRPTLNRQRILLGVEPKVSLEEGVKRVCKRVPERIAFGEEWR